MVVTLAAHLLFSVYASLQLGTLAVLPLVVLLLGLAQVLYVVPIALVFALTGRPRAVLGVAVTAVLAALPMLIVKGSGGIDFFPF